MAYTDYVLKNFEAMSNLGIKGILCFWCRLLLILIPIINACFSVYVLIITSEKIWLKAIGAAILSISIFILLCSIASSVFLILCCIGTKIGTTTNYTFLIAVIISAISFVIEACFLSQITKSKADLFLQDLMDYCIRNYDNLIVYKFLISHSSSFCIKRYVETRTTDLYGAAATFFALWLVIFVVHSLLLYLLSDPSAQSNIDNTNNDTPPSPDQLHDLTPS